MHGSDTDNCTLSGHSSTVAEIEVQPTKDVLVISLSLSDFNKEIDGYPPNACFSHAERDQSPVFIAVVGPFIRVLVVIGFVSLYI